MIEMEANYEIDRAIDLIKRIKTEETHERYIDRHKAFDLAIKTLEKQEKIKEAFEKWETDTSGIYGADDETSRLISTLRKILRSDEK